MNVQDKLERTLRDLHIMVSKGDKVSGKADKVAIDKKKAIGLLQQLNTVIYEMMDAYEVTQQSRNQAELEAKKKADRIIKDANKQADDIYAASVIYSDEALEKLQGIIDDTNSSMRELMGKINEGFREEKRIVRENQIELKSQLEDLQDTGKYLRIIEEKNKDALREKAIPEEERTQRRIDRERLEKILAEADQEAVDDMTAMEAEKSAEQQDGTEHKVSGADGQMEEKEKLKESMRMLTENVISANATPANAISSNETSANVTSSNETSVRERKEKIWENPREIQRFTPLNLEIKVNEEFLRRQGMTVDGGVMPEEEVSYSKPEIKINEEYFRKAGIPLDEAQQKSGQKATIPQKQNSKNSRNQKKSAKPNQSSRPLAVETEEDIPEILLSPEDQAKLQQELDMEYFNWKEDQPESKEPPKSKLFPFGKR